MGGAAFLIRGTVVEEKRKPVPIRRNILDRILSRTRYREPRVTDFGSGNHLIDLPAGELDKLPGEFRRFISNRLVDPWEASKAFLDYASSDVMSVFVRGERNLQRRETDWYIQFMFSGCAGTAEISAELGSHWADVWFKECRERLTHDFLDPYGFVADDARADQGRPAAFLPLGRLGYGLYVGNQSTEADTDFPGSKLFEMDAYLVEEVVPSNELDTLANLDASYGPLMSDGKCRCQLCMPEFDAASISGLPAVP